MTQSLPKIFQSLFDGINGLQDPLLGQRLSFKTARNPFIQILHHGRCHWITVSTFVCDHGEINYYDSLFKGKITDSVEKQIYNLLHSKVRKVRVHVMSVQQHKSKTNCVITISPLLILKQIILIPL